MSKAKAELTAAVIGQAIEGGKFFSMTQLAHSLGYQGAVSGSLTKKLRQLIPDIDARLAANKPAKDAGKGMLAKPTVQAAKPSAPKKAGKPDKAEPKTAKVRGGKYPHDPRNPFRAGSNYALVFDMLAAHPDGIEREKLVQLVSAASGKDIVHAGYDCQVLLSAKCNEPGLNPFEGGQRHRSCRTGFYVERTNGHVKLVLPKVS